MTARNVNPNFRAPATPPRTPRRPMRREIFGTTLVDEYAWLKAANWQEVLRVPDLLPDDVRAVLVAENAYSDAVLAPTLALQKMLVAEMRGRIKEDDSSPPLPLGDFRYYNRFREGGQYPLICRSARAGGEETLMLDGDALAAGKPFFQLGGTAVSQDQRLLAWSADDKGSEYFTLRVRDIAAGTDLPDIVPDTEGRPVWAADGSGFWYVRLDEQHRPTKVFFHRLGEAVEADRLVYEETEAGWFVRIAKSRDGRFLDVSISDHETSETWLGDRAHAGSPLRLVEERRTGVLYSVEPWADLVFIRTNADGAEDFAVLTAPLATPVRAAATPFVPHQLGTYILDCELFAGHLVRLERVDALPRIVVRSLATGEEHVIAFAEEAYSLGMIEQLEYDTTNLRFSYSSMTTPTEIYDYDMNSRARTLVKREEIPSGHDPAAYVTRRLFARAEDGESVPVSVLMRAQQTLDGTAPLLLYGYGSYGFAVPAAFSANRLSLVDRGVVYAIAHVRGGTDRGWHWYQDGKREKKPNTFSDFVAAARALCAQGYSRPGRIVGHGGSAGGMLMGAVANLAPDLFAGIVADVPFVDVLNTMLDDTLPLTPPEWPEWGNPIADEAAFRTIRSYSPYDNVGAKTYPAILALAGITDPRVTYWEPAKWVARLRERMTGGGPVLLHTNMAAGHAGASGRFSRLDEIAMVYAFALAAVGLVDSPTA